MNNPILRAGAGTKGHRKILKSDPTFRSWASMWWRVRNCSKYSGVTVCDRWRYYEFFLTDMGARPEGKTLDRKENSKGYSPDNCRWATNREQRHNRRDSLRASNAEIAELVSKIGEVAAAAHYGVTRQGVRYRLKQFRSGDDGSG